MKFKSKKEKLFLIIAIALLITISFFDWSFWSWIGLVGTMLISIGWYLKK